MEGGGVDGADVCGALVDLADGGFGIVVVSIAKVRGRAFLGAFVVDSEDVGFRGFGGSRAAASGGLGAFGDEGGELGGEGEGRGRGGG